jgi:transporter family-2 protein
MNPGTLASYAAWAALAGATIPVMAAMSGSLGRSLQSPIHASGIVVLVAAVGIIVAFVAFRPAMPSAAAFASAPLPVYFAGFAIAFYTLSASFLAPRFGVGNFVICVVVAQLIVSATIDQFGLLGAPVLQIGVRRAAGLALLAGGAALVAIK